MSMRKDSPVVGNRAWFDPIRNSDNAPGWGKNVPVTVVSIRRDVLCYVTVRNAAGEEREVPHFDLDCGFSFQSRNGEWLHESDPRVMKWLAEKARTPSAHPDVCVREKDVELRRHWQRSWTEIGCQT
jgi:hypothetical protein